MATKEKINTNNALTMPNSIEAEQRLLSCLLRHTAKQMDIASLLTIEDFYQPNHQQIFGVMQDIIATNEIVNYTTVIDALRRNGLLAQIGDVEYIDMLVNLLPSHAMYQQYLDIVLRQSTMRKIINICGEITKQAYSEVSAEYVIGNAEKAFFQLAQYGTRGGLESFVQVAADTLGKIQERYLNPNSIKGIPTGFKRLDDLTNGLHGGELIIIAARPGIGKSTLAMNLAENVARNHKTIAIFSLEMTNQQLVERLMASMANIPLGQIKSGKLANHDLDLARLHDTYSTIASTMSLYGNDTANVRPSEIVSQCRRLKKDNGLDLVIIDYIGLMQGDGRAENRQNEVATITKALKNMAKELDVPVIALSQLKREAETRNVGSNKGESTEPVLSDLRESGAIEQDADIVMFIHRDTTDGDATDVVLKVAKHRNGATANIPLKWLSERVKFVDEYSYNTDSEEQYSAPVEHNVGDTLVIGLDEQQSFVGEQDLDEQDNDIDKTEE